MKFRLDLDFGILLNAYPFMKIEIIASDFFHLNIEKVEFLQIPTYEETKVSYERD
ncbi:hypothetical protein DFP93_105122 [Aneurinibacillus soli]|uniref:Uncharacterized protein n=1 Tax=Aneurinibacillus soli TaxID=1500254 RepID=A0A0U4NIQ9_9BACL|nr:hypothetical protein DFP93_105122 [Aneurinibacillus soli]BAU28644.1 hypothetical protein CB4_02819 [Aneurinibacillus soli]